MTQHASPEHPTFGAQPALGPRFADALHYAWAVHQYDRRKGGTAPYLGHLLSVCGLVLADGGDEDEAIAALLHDTVEDHWPEVTLDLLEQRFGRRVRDLVAICTDTSEELPGDKRITWRARKERYIAHLHEQPPGDLRVPLADKLDNARAVLADYRCVGEQLWGRFHAGKEDQLWYYNGVAQAIAATGLRSPLLDELNRVLAELQQAVAGD